jgi:hypothetical protein
MMLPVDGVTDFSEFHSNAVTNPSTKELKDSLLVWVGLILHLEYLHLTVMLFPFDVVHPFCCAACGQHLIHR